MASTKAAQIAEGMAKNKNPHQGAEATLQQLQIGARDPNGCIAWGFPILRTVYTPGSDAQFQVAIRRIKDYWISALMEWQPDHGDSQHLYNTLVGYLYFPVFEDPQILDGLSLLQLRAPFHTWRTDQGVGTTYLRADWPRWRVCLVVDDVALHNICTLPEDPITAFNDETDRYYKHYIKALEWSGPETFQTDSEYLQQGYAKESIEAIRRQQDKEGFLKLSLLDTHQLWVETAATLLFSSLGEVGFEEDSDDLQLFCFTKEFIELA